MEWVLGMWWLLPNGLGISFGISSLTFSACIFCSLQCTTLVAHVNLFIAVHHTGGTCPMICTENVRFSIGWYV